MLLGAVLVIWGVVGFRILSALNPELPEVAEQIEVAELKMPRPSVIDTFEVHKENRDPFLGTWTKKKAKPKKKTTVKAVEWIPIIYHGAIEKKGTPSVFIVSINGVQHVLKKGQSRDEVTLLSGNAKRVVLRYKNERKSFSLSK